MFSNIFELIWLIGWALYLFGVYTPSMRRYRTMKVEQVRSRLFDVLIDFTVFTAWQLLPLVFILSPWLDYANYGLPPWAGWIGVAIFAFMLWLMWRAYTDLGRNWSPKIDVIEGHKLVTDGVYRTIRHPIYTGMWLWGLAQPLLIHNWVAGFGLLVAFLPLYFIRMPREEQMMLEHFGEEYRAYMERTGRVVPRMGS